MQVLPQTPPDWVLLAVALATEAARRVPMPRTFVDDPLLKALVTSAFALVRHPFYLAYALAWLAAPAATHGPLVTVFALLAIAAVIAARREERQLEDRFGEAYRAYKLGTGMLLPPVARLMSGRSST